LKDKINNLLSELQILFEDKKIYNFYKAIDSKLAKQPITAAPPLIYNDFGFNITKFSNEKLLNTGNLRPAIYTLYYKINFLKLLSNIQSENQNENTEELFKKNIEDSYEDFYLKEFTYFIKNENKFLSFLNYETSFQFYYIDSVIKEIAYLFEKLQKLKTQTKKSILSKLDKEYKEIDLSTIEKYIEYLKYFKTIEAQAIANSVIQKNNRIKEIAKLIINKNATELEKEEKILLTKDIKNICKTFFNPYEFNETDIKNFLLKTFDLDPHIPNVVKKSISNMVSYKIRHLLILKFKESWKDRKEEDILKIVNSGVKYALIYQSISKSQRNIDSLVTNNLKVFKSSIPAEKEFSKIEKTIHRLDYKLKTNKCLSEVDIYKEIIKTEYLKDIYMGIYRLAHIKDYRDNFVFNAEMKNIINNLAKTIYILLKKFKEEVLSEFYSSEVVDQIKFEEPLKFINLLVEESNIDNATIKELIVDKEFQVTLNKFFERLN